MAAAEKEEEPDPWRSPRGRGARPRGGRREAEELDPAAATDPASAATARTPEPSTPPRSRSNGGRNTTPTAPTRPPHRDRRNRRRPRYEAEAALGVASNPGASVPASRWSGVDLAQHLSCSDRSRTRRLVNPLDATEFYTPDETPWVPTARRSSSARGPGRSATPPSPPRFSAWTVRGAGPRAAPHRGATRRVQRRRAVQLGARRFPGDVRARASCTTTADGSPTSSRPPSRGSGPASSVPGEGQDFSAQARDGSQARVIAAAPTRPSRSCGTTRSTSADARDATRTRRREASQYARRGHRGTRRAQGALAHSLNPAALPAGAKDERCTCHPRAVREAQAVEPCRAGEMVIPRLLGHPPGLARVQAKVGRYMHAYVSLSTHSHRARAVANCSRLFCRLQTPERRARRGSEPVEAAIAVNTRSGGDVPVPQRGTS